MKLLIAANLGLGTNLLPPIFARRLSDYCIFEKMDRLVLINSFAPATDHWKALVQKDYKETLGEYSPIWRTTHIHHLAVVLGPDDQWLDWKEFEQIRLDYEKRGVTILREATNEIDGILITSGYAKIFSPPPEPPRWLTDRLRFTRPPLSTRERSGARREAIDEYAHWATKHGFSITVTGLPGLPQWGRVGDAWVGNPGGPPCALMVDTGYPDHSLIVRL